jgi:hypothetical protein
MSVQATHTMRWRAILDGALILLLLWILVSNQHLLPVKARSQTLGGEAIVVHSVSAPGQDAVSPARLNPRPELAPEDDTINAAMIAAENAALSAIQTLISLPLVTR